METDAQQLQVVTIISVIKCCSCHIYWSHYLSHNLFLRVKNIKCIKNLSIKKLGRNSDGMSERLLEDDEDDEDSDYVCKRLV